MGSDTLRIDADWEWHQKLREHSTPKPTGWHSTITLEAFVIPIAGAANPGSKGLLHHLLKRYLIKRCSYFVFQLPAVQASCPSMIEIVLFLNGSRSDDNFLHRLSSSTNGSIMQEGGSSFSWLFTLAGSSAFTDSLLPFRPVDGCCSMYWLNNLQSCRGCGTLQLVLTGRGSINLTPSPVEHAPRQNHSGSGNRRTCLDAAILGYRHYHDVCLSPTLSGALGSAQCHHIWNSGM